MVAWRRYPLIGACSVAGLLFFGCAEENSNQSLRRDQPISQPSNEDNPETARFATDILPQTHMAAGRLHESQNKFEMAIDQYQAVLKLDPGYVEAYNRIGIVLDRMGRFKDADRAFHRAIQLAPQYAHLHNNLGFSYTMQSRWPEAEQVLTKAVELKPGFARARINLAMVLAQQNKFEQAFGHFRAGLPLADAFYNMGLMYQSKGRTTEAAQAYKAALEHNPKLVAAQKRLDTLPEKVASAAKPFTVEELSPPPVAVVVATPVSPIVEPEPMVNMAETVAEQIEPTTEIRVEEQASPAEPAAPVATANPSTLEEEKVADLLAAQVEEATNNTPTTQPATEAIVVQTAQAPEPEAVQEPVPEPVEEPTPQPVAAAEPEAQPTPEPVAIAEPAPQPVAAVEPVAEPVAPEPELPDVLCLSIATDAPSRTTGSHLEPDWRLSTAHGPAIDSIGPDRRTSDTTLLPVSRSKQENDLQSLRMAPHQAIQLLKTMTKPIRRLFGPASPTEISEDQLSSPDLPPTPTAAQTADARKHPAVSPTPAR